MGEISERLSVSNSLAHGLGFLLGGSMQTIILLWVLLGVPFPNDMPNLIAYDIKMTAKLVSPGMYECKAFVFYKGKPYGNTLTVTTQVNALHEEAAVDFCNRDLVNWIASDPQQFREYFRD